MRHPTTLANVFQVVDHLCRSLNATSLLYTISLDTNRTNPDCYAYFSGAHRSKLSCLELGDAIMVALTSKWQSRAKDKVATWCAVDVGFLHLPWGRQQSTAILITCLSMGDWDDWASAQPDSSPRLRSRTRQPMVLTCRPSPGCRPCESTVRIITSTSGSPSLLFPLSLLAVQWWSWVWVVTAPHFASSDYWLCIVILRPSHPTTAEQKRKGAQAFHPPTPSSPPSATFFEMTDDRLCITSIFFAADRLQESTFFWGGRPKCSHFDQGF